ncbi:MAG: M28 family peptidase [Bacteroidetes bacterium]|nr:M28 family peptidase [Bacteroidota bacterium]
MKTTLRLCAFAVIFLSSHLLAQTDTVAIRYSKNITVAGLSKNLHVLASDEYEGRETGKKGQKMAAEYIAAQFKSAGIPPYKDNTFYQEFPLNLILPTPAEISVNGKQYKANTDYYSFPGQSEQKLEINEIQFLGYGIDDETYNDYKEIEVKDKVVMILAGEPFSNDSVSIITGKKKVSLWSTYSRIKTEKAKEKGVKTLLVVVDNIVEDLEDNKHRLESSSMKLDLKKTEMPVVYISKQMANEILKKQTVEKLKAKISESLKPVTAKAKADIIISIKNNIEKISSENVLGYVEGSDLKEELIVLTAHYDHLGIEGKIVYNGADDDGSGTVAIIELAQVYAKAKKEGLGPRRSMLFMTVAGEEKGLLGSSYYVEHPEFPLKNTVCDLNIDMIGRLDEKHLNNPNYVYLIGSDKLSSQLHNISESANKMYTKELELDYTYNDEKDKNRFYYRSDHYNFVKKGIPVIFYFNGVHADYHKETDEVEKINFEKMEKITRLVFFTAWEIANRNERIVVDSNKK